mgnify:CR=1 FL=1
MLQNNKKYNYVGKMPKKEINSITEPHLFEAKQKQYYNEALRELQYIDKIVKTDPLIKSYYNLFVSTVYEFYDKIGLKENLATLDDEYEKYKERYINVIKNYVMSLYLIIEIEDLKHLKSLQSPSLEYIQQQIKEKINEILDASLGCKNIDDPEIMDIVNLCKLKYINECMYGNIDIHTAKDKCYKEVKKGIYIYKVKNKISQLLSHKGRKK